MLLYIVSCRRGKHDVAPSLIIQTENQNLEAVARYFLTLMQEEDSYKSLPGRPLSQLEVCAISIIRPARLTPASIEERQSLADIIMRHIRYSIPKEAVAQ